MGLDTYLSHGSNMTHDKDSNQLDRSPGLVVMGDDSCSIGRGFESWHRIPDGRDIFSH